MFAVPGWNVSAPIATQIDTPKPKDPNKLGKKAQKRKQKQDDQVNAENLVEQWEKNVEGKNGKVKERQSAPEVGGDAPGEDAQEKRGKKRKRGKAGGRKNKQEGEDGDAKTESNGPVPEQDKEAGAQKVTLEKPSTATDPESKREKKKRKKDATTKAQPNGTEAAPSPMPTAAIDLLPEPKGLTPLQKSMRSKLASARFRHLNESLYTKPSADSLSLFKDDPSMFEDYHRGFAQQVDVWPENPVDGYVASILARGKLRVKDPWKEKKRAGKKGRPVQADTEPDSTITLSKDTPKPLPRNIKGHCTIADLGCGTASLSYRLQPHLTPLALTLHSFDLSRPPGVSGPLVTVADIAALPLPDNAVDVAIFCLALMGTNWLDFIDEAYRILRWRGELWVSEIKSRFGRVEKKKGGVPINSVGSLKKTMNADKDKKPLKGKKKAEEKEEVDLADEAELAVTVDGAAPSASASAGTDVSVFVDVLRKRGFVLDAPPERPNDAIDLSNKMFVKMHFVKAAHPSAGKNAREDQKAGAGARPAGLKMGIKGKKFGIVEEVEDEAVSREREGRVLKPCLYKVR